MGAAMLCFVILSGTEWEYADDVMNAVAVGSSVGMASTELLPTYVEFAIAGLLGGGFNLLLDPFCIGWAGKQGTSAFMGFCVTLGCQKLRLAKATHTSEPASK